MGKQTALSRLFGDLEVSTHEVKSTFSMLLNSNADGTADLRIRLDFALHGLHGITLHLPKEEAEKLKLGL